MTINLNHVANQVTTTGSATNIGPIFQAKGSGSFTFQHIGNGSYPGYVFTGSDSSATTMTFSTVGITMSGFAADIPITFTTKGISPVTLATAYGAHLKTGRTNSDTGSIVNYWQFSGSKTNEGVMMYALGSDTNISAYYYAKGTGGHIFNTGGTNFPQFSVAHTASASNYLQATGSTGFNPPTLSSQGTSSDLSLTLTPKGAGVVIITSGGIQLNGTTSGWVGLKGAAAAGSTTYTLPAADGTSGQVLSTNGSATLSWANAGGSSATPASVSDQVNTSTGYFDIPSGTTAQRPASPDTGMIRYNTTESKYEVYTSAGWAYLTSTLFPYTLDYLVVAGGGGGGFDDGGGGGAGGLLTATGYSVSPGGAGITITVGGGGGTNSNGSNSAFGSVATAIGGGGGGGTAAAGSGGSGGGAYYKTTGPGSGTSGQGYGGGTSVNGVPYPCGGGGGAGAAGANGAGSSGGNGGIGLTSAYSGTSTYYAGGGGGSCQSTVGSGGLGGGGAGGSGGGTNGTTNTGGGGGGGITGGSSGGSGIVIIRYAGAQKGTGGTVTSSGGYTIHTFTSSGTYSP